MLANEMTREEIIGWADSRETDYPIARAIHIMAADADEAQRIWESPTQAEIEEVMTSAWVHADADLHAMQWGAYTMTDEGHVR